MRLAELAGQRIAILGFGREGAATFRALSHHLPKPDLTVFAESGQLPDDLPGRIGPFDAALAQFDVVIRSPGVPIHHPALRALSPGSLINPSSIWLAERPDVPIIGVTGSKGKSTTSAMLAHVLSACGERVLLAGNIGSPLIDHLQTDADRVVVELSSYQLTDLIGRLQLGVFTRLFHEHLDWHGDAEHYVASKLRLFDLVADGVVLVNGQDALLMAATEGRHNRVMANWPPCLHRAEDGIFAGEGSHLQRVFNGAQWVVPGRHNLDNAALVLEAGRQLGHDLPTLTAALSSFKPLRHRLETVAQSVAQRWINDSIATSPHATHAALCSLPSQPVVLMVGGQRRPSDWQVVIDGLVHRPLAGLVVLPDSGAEIAERLIAAAAVKPDAVRSVSTMSAAVQAAAELAPMNSVVLLSPGAPSFSQYRDFEDRGDQFAAAAKAYCERLTE
jgi:UDP-N-acetylmuramoylalanine--D-glutamate ligase